MDWYTIDAMNQIAVYVARIKGRKNLLWFIPGMPVALMRDGGYGWGGETTDASTGSGTLFGGHNEGLDMGLVHRLMDVYERFTAEQIAVSPVDPRGVVGLGMAQLKAEAVAEQSGGEAFYNNNDLKSLDRQGHQPRFAVLYPLLHSAQAEGRRPLPPHQGRASTSRSLHLVYRQGYNAERVPTLDAPAPGPALMKASMEGNTPAATQILFDVGVWPGYAANPAANPQTQADAKSKPGKTVPYEIHYGFPPSEIAFTEDADGMLHGSLEFDAGRLRHLPQTRRPADPDRHDDPPPRGVR